VAIVLKAGSFNFLEPSGPVHVRAGIALPFYRKALVLSSSSRRQKLGVSNQVENMKKRNRLEDLGIEDNIKMKLK
jgi:hypothetical protein